MGLDEALQHLRHHLEGTGKGRLGDGEFGLMSGGKEHLPTGGGEALFIRDFEVIAADAHFFAANEEVGDLHGGDDTLVILGLFGVMMKTRGLDEQIGHAMTFEILGAEFGVVHAKDFVLDEQEIAATLERLMMNLSEMIGKRPSHDDFTHIVNEAGDVIRVIGRCLRGFHDLMGENGGADAMLPKFAPGKRALQGELLEILDDRRDHRELADLTDAEIEHGFLNTAHGGAQSVIDGIDETEEPRREAGIASDDLTNLSGVAVFGQNQAQQGLIDAA